MIFKRSYVLENAKKKKHSFASVFFKTIFALVIIVFLADVLFNLFFYQIKVEGASMQPTYNADLSLSEDASASIYKDNVVVKKFWSYQPGDIVIISVNNKEIIKRVIAVEFQTLTLKKHQADNFEYYHFYLDDKEIDESYLGQNFTAMNNLYFENFCHVQGVEKSGVGVNQQAQLVLKENELFALGDNRGNSEDAIDYRKPYSNSQVIGVVAFSYKYNQTLLQALWQKFLGIFV